MRTVVVFLTTATSNRWRAQLPESGESAPNQQQQQQQQPSGQLSAAADVPQCVGDSAVHDECQQSPLDTTPTLVYDGDSSLCDESFVMPPAVGSSVTVCSSADTSQSEECSETGELKSSSSTTTTTTTTTTTYSSSKRNRRNRSTESACWCSHSGSGSGSEGDNEDTDTSGSRASCFDVAESYDNVIERLEQEKRREESIMEAISSCMVMVSSLSGSIRGHVLEMFGTQRLTADRQRKFSRYRKIGERSVLQQEGARGPNRDFERRLQAIRAYVDDGSGHSEEEIETSTAPTPEEGACISTSSDTKQAADSSSGSPVAGCSKEVTPTVVNRMDGPMGRVTETLRQQSYEEGVRRRQVARKSWENQMVVLMCDVFEQQILKGKHTCRAMLSCMKSVADVVSLAQDAYRAAELAMQKARTLSTESAGDTLNAITSAAAETSVWMWKALKEAEAAVRIHAEIVEATERAERTLLAAKSENPYDDDSMRDMEAAVADIKRLMPRFAVFGSNAQQSGEQESGSNSDTPSSGSSSNVGSRTSPATGNAAGFQSQPADLLHNLLSATTSSLQAVGETARALQLFSTSHSCSGKKPRKRRGCAKKIVKDKDKP